MKVVRWIGPVIAEVIAPPSPARNKLDLLSQIEEKQQQAETALNLALGVTSHSRCLVTMAIAKVQPPQRGRRSHHSFPRSGVLDRRDIPQRLEAASND